MQINSIALPLQYMSHEPVSEKTTCVSHQFVDYLQSSDEPLDDKKKEWDKLSIQERKWVIIRLAQLPFNPLLSQIAQYLSGSKYVFPAKRNEWEILQGTLKPQDIQRRVQEDKGYLIKDLERYLRIYLDRLEQLNDLDELKELDEKIAKSDETLFFINWPISDEIKAETKIKITALYLFKQKLLSIDESSEFPEISYLFNKQAGLLCARQGLLEQACLFADKTEDLECVLKKIKKDWKVKIIPGKAKESIYLACARFYAKAGDIDSMLAFAKTLKDTPEGIEICSKRNLFYQSCAIAFAELGDSELALQFIHNMTEDDGLDKSFLLDSTFSACAKTFAKLGDLEKMDAFTSKTQLHSTIIIVRDTMYHRCAKALAQIGDISNAYQSASRCNELTKFLAWQDCSFASAQKGDREKALEFANKIPIVKGKNQTFFHCAIAFADMGDRENARFFIDKMSPSLDKVQAAQACEQALAAYDKFMGLAEETSKT